MFEIIRKWAITVLGILICLFTLFEVNFPQLQVQSALAVFVMLGLVLCFLVYPLHESLKDVLLVRLFDVGLALASVVCCLYVVVQGEEIFRAYWWDGLSVGDRAGAETTMDYVIGVLGVVLALEATRRSIGWVVPALALCFVLHSYYCYLSTARNEVQNISILGTADSGTFVLGFDGQTTSELAYDSTGSDLRSALQGLSTIGRGNASVAGPAGGPWRITFRNDLGNRNQAPIAVVESNLSGDDVRVRVSEGINGSSGELPRMPKWMLPHAGQSAKDISSTAFLKSLGIFGVAAGVMFKYVFLFVIFGAFLEISGATQFIIAFAERVFGRLPAGPPLVSVAGSALMGSLSGSAVANAVTTGAFTIPMMRNARFEPHTAGGITAAAASGGALVPPVMGAGAYMMLELVEPQVNFLQIAKAAVIPAALYYLSLGLIVWFYSQRMGAKAATGQKRRDLKLFDGVVFYIALKVLITLLLMKFTAFRAVSGSLVAIILLTTMRRELIPGQPISFFSRVPLWIGFLLGGGGYLALAGGGVFSGNADFRRIFETLLDASFVGMFLILLIGILHFAWRKKFVEALVKSSKNGISLVAASACVGIIIGIVQQTGIATDFSSAIKSIVEENLLVALLGIMACSIVLGMGVPSVVCYLLLATLMGALLRELGVIPLSAHMFIFYFGMMSMVTPPVALAAYASASIAEAKIMQTAFAAFRFSLVGFTLPFMFVYRPALLLMNKDAWGAWMEAEAAGSESAADLLEVAKEAWPTTSSLGIAVVVALVGITALAAGIAGYFRGPMSTPLRATALVAAAMMLVPSLVVQGQEIGIWVNVTGGVVFAVVAAVNRPGPKTPADVESSDGSAAEA